MTSRFRALTVSKQAPSRDTRIMVDTSCKVRCTFKVWDERHCSFPDALQHQAGQDLAYAAFCKENCHLKVAPAFFKRVEENDEDEWFKMQVWLLQYLLRNFKESDSAIIDAHDPEVFKLRLVQNDGWDADTKHVRFALFATIGSVRYMTSGTLQL